MATLTITRVTHSCVLLDIAGTKILTDPWFSEKTGYLRGEPLAYTPQELPHLDGVLVSHGHYDHYDMQAFQAYPDKSVPIVVKRGIAAEARDVGFRSVVELDPWETARVGELTITAAPAKHGVPENTYVVQSPDFTIFFGADTLLIPELREVATRFPQIDLALFAVNGLQIRPAFNRQVVMNAREAVELAELLRPRVAVPTHYTFTAGALRDRLLLKYTGTAAQFAQEMAQRVPATAVHILDPGEPLEVQSLA
ncbi:MAG TPA: MBL fold metallo-hydrolase [Ktedonobacteraceae bacterium]|nr:MBL fold metallo-hydrolase [Ktedonobacteraceae bacterium]